MNLLWIELFIVISVYFIVVLFYRKTDYFKQTGYLFLSILLDKGRRGEFLLYWKLRTLKGYKKYLFNVYVPKNNGETTELDLVMLHESGIYVFESKNYSGWIFGTETQMKWTQTLPAGRNVHKEYFMNPIIQNKMHIKWLRFFLNEEFIPIYSYIVFGNRCELKEMKVTSSDYHVVNQYELLEEIYDSDEIQKHRLSVQQIDHYFQELYPYTQLNEEEKMEHVKKLQEKYKRE